MSGGAECGIPHDSLTITSLNVGSLANKIEGVLAMGSDITCLQEVKLTSVGQEMMTRHVEQDGRFSPLWGEPRPGIVVDGQESPNKAQRGGVGLMVQKNRPTILQKAASAKEDGRWLHAMVNLDGRDTWLHLFVVYCHSGHQNKTKRERLLDKILNEMRSLLGEVPIMVLGDMNTEVQDSPVLQQAVANDWVDAAALQALDEDKGPEHTFVRQATNTRTRIDYALLNPIAAAGLQRTWVHDTVHTNEHRCLSVKICIPGIKQRTFRYFVPKELPMKRDDELAERLLQEAGYDELCQEGDTDKLYTKLADLTERYGVTGVEQQRPYRGRAAVNKPVERCITAKSARGAIGAVVGKQKAASAIMRKTRHLDKELTTVLRNGSIGALANATMNTWKNVCEGVRKLDWNLETERDLLKGDLDEALIEVQRLDEALAQRVRELDKRARMRREAKYEERLNTHFREERRRMTAFVRNSQTAGAQAVANSEGAMTADLREMDGMMHEEWDRIFCLYEEGGEPKYQDFKERYGAYIEKNEMALLPLTGSDLREVLMKKTKKTSPGVDGWRMAELRAMPQVLLDAWAKMFNVIEVSGRWPEALLTALVTLVPKGGEKTPLNHRPITVTSAVYRLWACARLQNIIPWQEGWIHPTQHGFRPKRGTDSLLMELSTQLEEALLHQIPLNGLALDFVKCFDRIPQEVAFGLMEDLGMHGRILRPLRGMYARMKRRFRFPIGVGREFRVTNGILQGCPISVIMVNAMVSVMVRCVTVEVPGAWSLSYADDAYLLAILRKALKAAAEKTVEFCNATGMLLNVDKSHAFTTKTDELEEKLECSDMSFKVKQEVKSLGVMLCTDGKHRLTKTKSAEDELARLGALPLTFHNKTEMLLGTVLPACLYGATYAEPSEDLLKRLRTAAAKALWGPHFTMRNPIALLSVALPGHTALPEAKVCYTAINCIVREGRGSEELWSRIKKIAQIYEDTELPAVGPVGTAVRRWLPLVEKKWQFMEGLYEKSAHERKHQVREVLRPAIMKQLVSCRPTFEDAEKGAHPLTNSMWRKTLARHPLSAFRTRRVICGAIFTVHPKVWSKKLDVADKLTCDVCDHQAETTEQITEHALWECAPARQAQQESVYAEVKREGLPKATALHGVVVRGTGAEVQKQARLVQSYLVRVVALRDSRAAERTVHVIRPYPWKETTTGTRCPVPTEEMPGTDGGDACCARSNG
eukprot:TRINITY_DN326_c1_g1_i7.p1 TRINITY_DN326_c1_g1~~TRINITY_DN326_c1_g1_i7.p1  ORF type:complete len:1215 (+),score=217.14 TRINITY_DN326_c1_g1_i7:1591-5235(+)